MTNLLVIAGECQIDTPRRHHLHNGALAHRGDRVRKEVVDAIIVDIGDQAGCFREVVVAEQDGDIISPDGVDGGIAAPRPGIVNDVIMDKGRQVNHLEGHAERQQLVEAIRVHFA